MAGVTGGPARPDVSICLRRGVQLDGPGPDREVASVGWHSLIRASLQQVLSLVQPPPRRMRWLQPDGPGPDRAAASDGRHRHNPRQFQVQWQTRQAEPAGPDSQRLPEEMRAVRQSRSGRGGGVGWAARPIPQIRSQSIGRHNGRSSRAQKVSACRNLVRKS